MKYQVIYQSQKKQKEVATFYRLEDAALWEKHVISQGHRKVEIVPVF